jgi:anthranilate 1,2-dioxygenase small subunit
VLERQLTQFLAQQEVVQYVRRLAWLLDNFRLGEFIEEFCDDGGYRLIPRENLEAGHPVCIIDDDKKRLRYRRELVEKHWHYEKFRELRMLSPVSVEVDGERARASTNFALYITDDEGNTSFHVCGVFEDEFRMLEGRWRIHTRHATLDTYLPRHAIVIPP